MPAFVEHFEHVKLSDAQWLPLAPPSAASRLRLALLLERVRPAAGVHVARIAQDGLVGGTDLLAARWVTARLLLALGDPAAASRALEGAVDIDPGNPEINRLRGDAFTASGDPRALDAYRAAVDVFVERTAKAPNRDYIALPVTDVPLRALILERTGRGTTRHRKTLASYLERRGFADQALAEWRQIVGETPGDADAHFRFAAALERGGARDEALEEYRRAVTLNGRSEYRQRLAERLWQTEQFYQAIVEWRTVVSQEPRNVAARLALARAYARAGDANEAFAHYAEILKLEPDHSSALAEAGRLRR
jgi:tetratricopeptide (TPR) repeat protein